MTLDEEMYRAFREEEAKRQAADALAKQAAYDAALSHLSRAPEEVPRTRAVIAVVAKDRWWDDVAALLIFLFALAGALPSALGANLALRGAPQLAVKAGTVAALVSVLVLLSAAGVWLAGRLDRARQRDALIHTGADTVLACVNALAAPDAERAALLQKVDDLYRRTEAGVLNAHRTRGTMGRSSPRRTTARRHAELVAGALRRDLCRVDVDPKDALRDLAGRLVEVCERYAEGRVGRLLPETDLTGVTPVTLTRRALRESAHMAVVVVAGFCGALGGWLGGQSLGLPDDFPLGAALVGLLLGGTLTGGWHRVARLAELLPGR
ncbi:hypothetical protein [Streptomyces zingiberis]|uniref:Integral membrane protein n=1 Tax=Streptomyces zingiberis TaxID=2053010 RepID=A0ABX1C057_9ACTN|nr:hypothetical protein [Streptomyces zingiberis]NJQ03301.1 hypothetical protein [Streptomyces zingiberis]